GNLYTFNGRKTGKKEYSIKLNGKIIHPKVEDGYAIIKRSWQAGDTVGLHLPMKVQTIQANNKVKDDRGKIALQRGPLAYWLEGPDNTNEKVLNMIVDPNQSFETSYNSHLLDGVTVIRGNGKEAKKMNGEMKTTPVDFTAIPYYTWANRGGHEMTVWIP